MSSYTSPKRLPIDVITSDNKIPVDRTRNGAVANSALKNPAGISAPWIDRKDRWTVPSGICAPKPKRRRSGPCGTADNARGTRNRKRGRGGGNDDDAVDGWTMLTHAVHPGIATRGIDALAVCESGRQELAVVSRRYAVPSMHCSCSTTHRAASRRAGSAAGRRDSGAG